MNDIILIDKPSGFSSFDVIRQLKKKNRNLKIGYLGTLDPLATGLLILFLGAATKLIRNYEGLDKEYLMVMELGKISDTFDSTGKIETNSVENFPSYSQFESCVKKFIGQQWQIQPPFSAIHFKGKRAYERARSGERINLGKRQVVIHSIHILHYAPPHIMLNIVCESGTYMRSLAHEIGAALGTGALMTSLRRTKIGPFHVNDAKPLVPCSYNMSTAVD